MNFEELKTKAEELKTKAEELAEALNEYEEEMEGDEEAEESKDEENEDSEEDKWVNVYKNQSVISRWTFDLLPPLRVGFYLINSFQLLPTLDKY